ncbi:enoyl-CoA hydratase [Pelagibius marinus]|uniref:enoyl-CoA hydratase n=1 Tax=Pelagibius marinus TaxID=2762760 RepID=UPI0018732576|nr:enoyl-CoA hydratase [Pelagibius marinus]
MASESATDQQSDKMLGRKDGAIGHLIFNNPEKHNAVSLEMWDAADRILDDFAADAEVRVVVLSGAGGKSFVSGADISKFEKERGSEDAVHHYNERIKGVYGRVELFAKPTIAMVNGYCLGGGLNLAAACDLRFCSAKSKFGMPAARLALGYPYHAIRRLINAVGPSAAKYLMFSAERIDAEEAFRLGLVQKVLPEEELESFVAGVAGRIAGNAPLTVKAMKAITNEVLKDPEDTDLALCDRLVADCFASEDYKEGRRAFMEKRDPDFKGR